MTDTPQRVAELQLGGYQDLRVWQASVELATECYLRTAGFPSSERFGLTAQMRAAAVSVVSNIAEGHGRGSNRAFNSFLAIAHGSLKELEAQVVLARRLQLLSMTDAATMAALCQATGRMLHGLRRSLRARSANARSPAADAVPQQGPSADGRRPAADAAPQQGCSANARRPAADAVP